jgi:GT2 family glycosyltransferase
VRRVAIIIPTWNNIQYLTMTIRSLRERTDGQDYRLIVVPNGCTDGTWHWCQKEGIETVPFNQSIGFVKATNAGMEKVQPGEHVLLLNDDVRITDPGWLFTLTRMLDENVGAVGPVSNFVMGSQDFRWDNLPRVHEAPFLIGFCMMISEKAFARVGKLDEAYGIGTNDDLDYSLAIRKAGLKLLVNRGVFVFHYGARSIMRVGNYDQIQGETRKALVAKWGERAVSDMFQELEKIRVASKMPKREIA